MSRRSTGANTPRGFAACLGIAVLVAGSGCNAGRAFIAPAADYSDYRQVRLATSYDQRMTAAAQYLEDRPEGVYAERLRRYFDRAEPVYFRARQRNIAGLEAYLQALPAGPHAKEALDLLIVLRGEKRRSSLDARSTRVTGMRIDAQIARRVAAQTLLSWWVRALLNPQLWQAPLSEAPSEWLVRYRLALPAPRCGEPDERGERRCRKRLEQRFEVRGDDGVEERKVDAELELLLDAGWRLRGATLSGANLFLRGQEAELRKILPDDDAEQRRAAAAAFSARLTKALFAAEIECNGGSDARGITTMECEGLQLTIQPAQGLGEEDLLIIAPSATAPTPGPATADPAAPEPPAPEPPAPEPPAQQPAAPTPEPAAPAPKPAAPAPEPVSPAPKPAAPEPSEDPYD